MKKCRNLLLPGLLIALLIVSVVACRGKGNLESRHAEVMAIHDEVMPLMADMSRQRRQLERDLPQRDSSELQQIKEIIYALQTAEKGMWDWMAAYQKPTSLNEETTVYMDQQEKAIRKVSSDMKDAMKRANEIPEL